MCPRVNKLVLRAMCMHFIHIFPLAAEAPIGCSAILGSDWAIFESSWQNIFLQQLPRYLATFIFDTVTLFSKNNYDYFLRSFLGEIGLLFNFILQTFLKIS